MTATREMQLQELFATLSRVELDDLAAVERAVSARRDYLIHVKLLTIPIGGDIRWVGRDGRLFDGLLIHHHKKSVTVHITHMDGGAWDDTESNEETVHYESIDWSVVEQRRGNRA